MIEVYCNTHWTSGNQQLGYPLSVKRQPFAARMLVPSKRLQLVALAIGFTIGLFLLPRLAVAQSPDLLRQLKPYEEEQVLALDPQFVTEREVRDVLSKAPAPRLMLFKGTLLADMESFGRFLHQMGYPDEKVRNPTTGTYSYQFTWVFGCFCLECSDMIVALAWYYEHEGIVPMLVGHSGGGVAVSRTLHGLAEAKLGADTDNNVQNRRISVFNSATKTVESRYMIRNPLRDPLTGASRAVHDLRVPFASMFATGSLLRIFGFGLAPGCILDAPTLGKVPGSVEDFTGFRIANDPFTAILGFGDYKPSEAGATTPTIRNLRLSEKVDHVAAFQVDGYAENALVRAWINEYQPGTTMPVPKVIGLDLTNIEHVADLWHSFKKHWVLHAKQWVIKRRAAAKNSQI